MTTSTELVLHLPYPPTVNHYWKHSRGRFHISNEGQEYREAVAMVSTPWVNSCSGDDGHNPNCGGQCATQVVPLLAMSGPLSVTIHATPPDKRKRDLDNIIKAILDSLEHAGVYEDDSQIHRLEVEWDRTGTPGCGVTIRPYT